MNQLNTGNVVHYFNERVLDTRLGIVIDNNRKVMLINPNYTPVRNQMGEIMFDTVLEGNAVYGVWNSWNEYRDRKEA